MAVLQRAMLVLPGGPESAPSARRQARRALEDWECAPGVVEDAVLLLSELVANAVLHAGEAQSAALVLYDDRVRLEVGDRSPVAPSPSAYGVHAHTGRGLRLVEALAADWGYARQEGGKVVWADLRLPEAASAPPLPGAFTAGPAEGAEGTGPDGTRRLARFANVSVRDYLALREQNDAVLRDVDLLLIGADEGLTASVPEEVLAACRRLRTQFGDPAGSYRAAVLAAEAAGDDRVELVGPLPAAGGHMAREYVQLLETIEAFAAAGLLFVEPPSPAVIALRRWFVEETIAQEAGTAPAP